MAQEYLERLSSLMGRMPFGSFKGMKLECKHFFSGAAVYVDGRICMSWTPAGFAMKLPAASRRALLGQQGAKYLRYFPKSPIKKDYVVLPKSILGQIRMFSRLAKTSITYALSQPPMRRKKSGMKGDSTGRGSQRRAN